MGVSGKNNKQVGRKCTAKVKWLRRQRNDKGDVGTGGRNFSRYSDHVFFKV